MSAPGDGYPTEWPVVSYACNNVKCRVDRYTGTPVYPFVACPVCQKDGTETGGAS